MKNNTFNKLREQDRHYDYGDYWSPAGKRFTKKRSHKRSRQQLKVFVSNLEKVAQIVLKKFLCYYKYRK